MRNKTIFVEVILPLPLRQLFTYEVPTDYLSGIEAGMRVVVPFGKKKLYTGMVRNISDTRPHYATKEIMSVLDDSPVVSELHLQFWEWTSEYYMCSLGEVFRAALPAGMKPEGETVLSLEEIEDLTELNTKERQVIDILAGEETLSLSNLRKKLDFNGIYTLNKLKEKNIITVEEKIKHRYKPKTEKLLKLSDDIISVGLTKEKVEILGRAPKQKSALETFIKLTKSEKSTKLQSEGFVKRTDFIEKNNFSSAVIKELIKKGFVEEYEQEVDRLKDDSSLLEEKKILSSAQASALKNIRNGFSEKDVVLLHGLTSSGKTELYIELIEEQLQNGKQVLYLLPEIALSTQIIKRLKKIFADKVGIYHSKYSDAERTEVWKNISSAYQHNRYEVILGVRSSIFLPFDNLGLIIVDEEHENTYKQFQAAPRYNAANLAVVLAKFHLAKVLLGTATPSVESYYNATTDKYALVELTERYKNIQLPEIIIADRKESHRKKMMKSIFTPELYKAMNEALANNEQIILFQNRRGYSPFIECSRCAYVPRCEHCDVSLTYHKYSDRLICHYCGFSYQLPEICPECRQPKLKPAGFGTEKIEDEAAIWFPDAKTIRMDLDTASRKKSYQKIISDFESKKADILIGTQMVSKGLDFENVAVVGIMHADMMLNFPDFRSYERSFQLMMQVSGRAGRHKKRGKVIIQTNSKEHPVIANVLTNDYFGMFEAQIDERKLFHYPPFYRLLIVSITDKNNSLVDDAAEKTAVVLRKYFGKLVLGPEYPPVSRVKNRYIKNILVKIDRRKSVKRSKYIIEKTVNHIKMSKKYRYVRFIFDVDPV